jgi:hypothetical protein
MTISCSLMRHATSCAGRPRQRAEDEHDPERRGEALEDRLGTGARDDRVAQAVGDVGQRVVLRDRVDRRAEQRRGVERRRDEQHDEDEREDALHSRRAAGAQRDRLADRAEADRGDDADRQQAQRADGAALEVRPEDEAQQQEVEDLHHGDDRGGGQPPEHDRHARDRRGDQPVEEAALDLQRSRDPRHDAGQQQRLRHRRGQLEVQEAVDLGKSGQVGRARQAADVHRQEQRREDQHRGHELRPAQHVHERAAGEREDRADHAGAGTSSSRCWPVFSTKTSSSVGSTSSSAATASPPRRARGRSARSRRHRSRRRPRRRRPLAAGAVAVGDQHLARALDVEARRT